MALDYFFQIKDSYTFTEQQKITLEATMNLNMHLMETLFINKLTPCYKEYLLLQEPDLLI
jgi:hypothetical protein